MCVCAFSPSLRLYFRPRGVIERGKLWYYSTAWVRACDLLNGAVLVQGVRAVVIVGGKTPIVLCRAGALFDSSGGGFFKGCLPAVESDMASRDGFEPWSEP